MTPASCTSQVKGARLDELELPPMVINNQDPKQTAFTVSVDVKVQSPLGLNSPGRRAIA